MQVTSALIWITVTMNPSEKRIIGNPGCVVTENRWRILSDSEIMELGETGLPSGENTFPSCPVLQKKEIVSKEQFRHRSNTSNPMGPEFFTIA